MTESKKPALNKVELSNNGMPSVADMQEAVAIGLKAVAELRVGEVFTGAFGVADQHYDRKNVLHRLCVTAYVDAMQKVEVWTAEEDNENVIKRIVRL